jgi:hypothetical protein
MRFVSFLARMTSAHISSPSTGIGLFTYHKYRKSLDSTVALDAHGNPISSTLPEDVELDEREQFVPLRGRVRHSLVCHKLRH